MATPKIVLSLSATLALILPAGARAEHHVFTTREGRFFRGEMVNANAEQMVMKTTDGQAVTLALKDLIGADQDYVVAHANGRGGEHRQNFEVSWEKEKVKSTQDTVKHVKTTRTTYVTHVKIRNKSDQATGDLDVHYQLYYNDVEGAKTTLKHKDGVIKLPSMQAGATTSVDTDTLELKFLQVVDGYSYVNRAPDRQVDSFKGVAVTFKLQNKPVFEYVSPGITKAP